MCKLFVGQVPASVDEMALKEVFSPYGEVKEITILKDRTTNTPKGCGFVSFTTPEAAKAAIDALADKVTLPGAKRELIVNIAGVPDDKTEHKLYVGMLSHKTTEDEIQNMFAAFGNVLEVYLMKNNDGSSKGSCFVKYRTQEEAQAAVDALNDVTRDKDAPSNLQVRFAHTKAEREQRMAMQTLGAQTVAWQQPVQQMYQQQYYQQPYVQAPYYQQVSYATDPATQLAYATQPQAQAAAGALPPMPQDYTGALPPMVQQYVPQQQYAGYQMMAQQAPVYAAVQQNGGGRQHQQTKGPPGANLFVYGIPDSYQDADLEALFANFGTVVSAKVQIDLTTQRSKGFGFVSFDTVQNAQTAIASMDGYQVGNRKLSVRVKKGEPGATPQPQRYAPY